MEEKNYWEYALLASWVIVIAIAVFLMIDGQILGENTTGIAIVFGIIGLGLITNWNKNRHRKKSK